MKGGSEKPIAAKEYLVEWITHIIGDMHEPLNVGQLEGRGGNLTSITFAGEKTNLHRLWDMNLIDHSGLNYVELADSLDKTIISSRTGQLQKDNIIQWLYESYQISSELRVKEIKSSSAYDIYYQENFRIIKKRLADAGIRLAGILNDCLDNNPNYQAN